MRKPSAFITWDFCHFKHHRCSSSHNSPTSIQSSPTFCSDIYVTKANYSLLTLLTLLRLFKLLTWFTVLPGFNKWDLPCDIHRKIQTFKLGATLRSLLPSLPGSEMRVGSLLKINPSLNVDQAKRQESENKNWAEARTWTTKEKHQGAKGKPGYLSVFKIMKSEGVALEFGE